MLFTDNLYPNTLRARNNEAIAKLQAQNDQYDQVAASISKFVDDPTIYSSGIRALKQQLEDYLTIITAIKQANQYDIDTYEIVNGQIGTEDLQGHAVPTRALHVALKMISDAKAAYYMSKYYLSGGTDSSLKSIADSYRDESDSHQSIIDECTRIIDAYDVIESVTKAFLQISDSRYRDQITAALESMGKAFANGEYNPNLGDSWRDSILDKDMLMSTLTTLKNLGVTDEQIENMTTKGYSLSEIYEFIACAKTDLDKEFLNALMNRDYEAAFQIDPYDLSDNMFVCAADYSVHMLQFDSNNAYDYRGEIPVDLENLTEFDELEDFCNAMIAADQLHDTNEYLTYGGFYLVNITGSVSTMTQIQAGAVAAMNSEDLVFDEQMAEYYRTRAAFNFWSAVNSLYYKFNYSAAGLLHSVSISNLNFGLHADGTSKEGYISFDIQHASAATNDEIKTDHINVQSLTTADFQSEKKLESLEAARVQYENAAQRMLTNTIKGVSFVALADLVPGLAIPLSFFDIMCNNGRQLYGTDDYICTQGSEIASDLLTGIVQICLSKSNLDAAQQEAFFETFGDGACIRVGEGSETFTAGDGFISSYGIYDPGTIHMMAEWQENGMDAWATFGTNSKTGEVLTVDDVKNYINENDTINQEMKELCIELLDGPNDLLSIISGGDGQIDKTDMEKFMEAMNYIQVEGNADNLYVQFQTSAQAFDAGTQ